MQTKDFCPQHCDETHIEINHDKESCWDAQHVAPKAALEVLCAKACRCEDFVPPSDKRLFGSFIYLNSITTPHTLTIFDIVSQHDGHKDPGDDNVSETLKSQFDKMLSLLCKYGMSFHSYFDSDSPASKKVSFHYPASPGVGKAA